MRLLAAIPAYCLLFVGSAAAQGQMPPHPEVYRQLAKVAIVFVDRTQITGAEAEAAYNVRLMLQAILDGKLVVQPAQPLPAPQPNPPASEPRQ